MTTLTLIAGEAQQVFEEHPIEVARRALIAAADLEDGDGPWRDALRRCASLLPDRGRVARECWHAERERWEEEWRERKDAWKQIPPARRESLLLSVLGDESLLIREMAERMNVELGFSREKRAIAEYEARPLVARMFRDGQLERVPEMFNKTHMRYRYFRKP